QGVDDVRLLHGALHHADALTGCELAETGDGRTGGHDEREVSEVVAVGEPDGAAPGVGGGDRRGRHVEPPGGGLRQQAREVGADEVDPQAELVGDGAEQLVVEAGELAVAPNPFTPNADGYNDEVIFDLRDFEGQELELKIFGLRGELLRAFNATRAVEFRWNGKSESGEPQYPGPYLYLLTDRGKKIASGYIVLAR
ncbi:hypothetical protein FBQ85_27325, partial [Cytophagia bacterium CHB2]|nr:hypothetical protein [Cytophagia bacterium CHB2]